MYVGVVDENERAGMLKSASG